MTTDPGDDVDPTQPQSWNKYAFVRNNPLLYVDPDGRAVTYADKRLENLVTGVARRSELVRGTLSLYTGEGAPDLFITRGGAGTDISGEKALGDFTASIEPTSYDTDKVRGMEDLLPETGKNLTGAKLIRGTITLDTSKTTPGQVDELKTLAHELGHADSAARNPVSYLKLGAKDKERGPDGKVIEHDKRPLEQQANDYRDRVLRQAPPRR